MRTFSKIAMAVAASLTGGAAFALPPTTAFDVKLVVAGSSAFRDPFKTELQALCSDTIDAYATQSGGPDFKAYTCTLNSSAGTGLNGLKAIVYYRSEGGSVWGAVTAHKTLASGTSVNRLDISSACTGPVSNVYTCSVTGYDLLTDASVTNLALDKVGLGIADVEPAMFVNDNLPAVPTAVAVANRPSATKLAGQAFAVYANSSLGLTSLSKQTLTSIFSGAITDWSTVPNAAGTGFVTATSTPIVICKRDVGSGTQVGADIYFNGTNCLSGSVPFAASSLPLNNSTGAETTCIGSAANPGAIGYAAIQNSVPSGTSIINLDGITPSRVNAANGTYGYWFELVAAKPTTYPADVAGTPSLAKGGTLATTLMNRVKAAATVPASPNNSIFALPGGSNSIALPVSSSNPVGIGSRGGNSCKNPSNQNG